jgi:hypothetical protein
MGLTGLESLDIQTGTATLSGHVTIHHGLQFTVIS